MSYNQAVTTAVEALNRNANLYFSQKSIIDQRLVELDQRVAQKEAQIDAVMAQWGIAKDTTLEVGTGRDFSSIQAAWNEVSRSQLKGSVTIKVNDGVYEQSSIWLANQPYAAFIRIIGNIANPDNCVLRFVNDSNGKSHGSQVRNCWGLEFSGFKSTSADRDNNYRGLWVGENSYVYSADNSLIFDNCLLGIESTASSVVRARGVRAAGCLYGASVNNNAQANLSTFQSIGPGKDHNSNGRGMRASSGGMITAYGADIRNHAVGVIAESNGYLWCDGSEAHNCQYGFLSAWGGLVWNHVNAGANPQGKAINCDHGFRAHSGGQLLAVGALADGCQYGFSVGAFSHLSANESHAKNCTDHGYHANAMSLIEAWNTQANASGNATDYNLAHGTAGNYGALIRRS